MKSTFDKQLEKILSGDVSDLVDAHVESEEDELEEVVEELLPVVYEEKSSAVVVDSPDLSEDYKFARSNLYGLIGRTNAALDLALKISAMSEHPRALEVAASLIKTSSDVSRELLALHKQLEAKSQGKPGTPNPDGQYTQINNTYYVSPEEAKSVDDLLDDLPEENERKPRKEKKNKKGSRETD